MINWKSITALGGVAMTALSAFFYAPIPLTTGNVTAARYIYNIPQDIRAEVARVDRESIERDIINKVSSIKRDRASLVESRRDLVLQNYKIQLMLLEDKAERTNDSNLYDDKEKTRRMIEIERRLDRLYDKVDDGGFKQDELRSANDDMMFADAR